MIARPPLSMPAAAAVSGPMRTEAIDGCSCSGIWERSHFLL
jgi:hypothetical protein